MPARGLLLPALLWALLILVLCLLPGAALPQWRWADLINVDKLVHAMMFFVQAILFARLFLGHGRPRRWLLWAVVLTAAYGLGLEFMQGIEGLGRRMDPNDMIANTIGACTAGWYAHRRSAQGKSVVPYALLR